MNSTAHLHPDRLLVTKFLGVYLNPNSVGLTNDDVGYYLKLTLSFVRSRECVPHTKIFRPLSILQQARIIASHPAYCLGCKKLKPNLPVGMILLHCAEIDCSMTEGIKLQDNIRYGFNYGHLFGVDYTLDVLLALLSYSIKNK